jgi:hypothetical protein
VDSVSQDFEKISQIFKADGINAVLLKDHHPVFDCSKFYRIRKWQSEKKKNGLNNRKDIKK